MAILILLYEA